MAIAAHMDKDDKMKQNDGGLSPANIQWWVNMEKNMAGIWCEKIEL